MLVHAFTVQGYLQNASTIKLLPPSSPWRSTLTPVTYKVSISFMKTFLHSTQLSHSEPE